MAQPTSVPLELPASAPLGARHDGSGASFALFSSVAEGVELCLFDDSGEESLPSPPASAGRRANSLRAASRSSEVGPVMPRDGLDLDVRHGDTSVRGWWLTFVRGLVALSLGGALLVAGAGQSRLATFIGAYWLLGSVLTLRWVWRSRGIPSRRLGALAAAIGAVTAVALLARRPLDDVVSTGVLLDLVGAGAIATGAMRMLGGFRDDQLAEERPRKRDSMLVGALDAGLGIALILTSDSTSTWVRLLAATWGLVGGTFLLVDALRLRRVARTSVEPRRDLQLG